MRMPTSFADAHLHLFETGFSSETTSTPGAELAAYEQVRRRHTIERGLVVGYEGESRHRGNNEYILTAAKSSPWIAPLPYLEPSPPPRVASLRSLQTRGAMGYAVYAPATRSAEAIAGWPADVLAELNGQNAILSINAPPSAVEALAPFVRAVDRCTVLFSHLGLPGRFRDVPPADAARSLLRPLLRLAEVPHVSVKFSGLYAVSDPAHDFPHRAAHPFVEALLSALGPRRVLWGSDFPPALEHVSFAQTLDERLLAGCSASEIADIMGGNLMRVLKAQARARP